MGRPIKDYGIQMDVPYPENLARFMSEFIKKKNIEITSNGVLKMIDEVFSERDKLVIEMKFRDWMRLQDIGDKLGVSRERARVIVEHLVKTLKSEECLKRASYVSYLDYEKEVEEHNETKMTVRELKTKLAEYGVCVDGEGTTIQNMFLTVRSTNALLSGGYKNMGDILKVPNIETLGNVRNLGVKSVNEIISRVHGMGYKMQWEA